MNQLNQNECVDDPAHCERLEQAAGVLKALGHPYRLRIVELLERGEMTVSALQQALGAHQSHTSQQLGRMKALGVVRSRRDGNQMHYSIANPAVLKVIHCLRGGAVGVTEQGRPAGGLK